MVKFRGKEITRGLRYAALPTIKEEEPDVLVSTTVTDQGPKPVSKTDKVKGRGIPSAPEVVAGPSVVVKNWGNALDTQKVIDEIGKRLKHISTRAPTVEDKSK
jgi:hypothetical protein